MNRLLAVTHGDPAQESNCGRPLYCQKADKKDEATLVYFCPLHGPIKDRTPFAFFADDERVRKRFDY